MTDSVLSRVQRLRAKWLGPGSLKNKFLRPESVNYGTILQRVKI